MKFYFVLGIMIGLIQTEIDAFLDEQRKNTTEYIEAVFWEVKPYIYRNEHGDLDGIIPMIFQEGSFFCSKYISRDRHLIEFKHQLQNRREFSKLFMLDAAQKNISRQNHNVYQNTNTTFYQNVTKKTLFFGPVLTYIDRAAKLKLRTKNLTSFRLLKSKTIVVVVPRYVVSLPHKIIRGILSCQQIFVLALLLAVFFGIVIWVPERQKNMLFDKYFVKGMPTGIWWSIVSMTTVGYGDIYPKSLRGRFVAVFWLIIGVVLACVMTATMTDVVTGSSDFPIHGQKVAVLENSHEEKIASNDYRARVVPAQSYEEVLQIVRDQKAVAAMINEEVAAWYQDYIHNDSLSMPLRIIQKLPANLYVKCLISSNIPENLKDIFKCMHQQQDEVYIAPQEHFQRYTKVELLYVQSVLNLFLENLVIQVLSGIVVSMFIIGFVCDYVRYCRYKHGYIQKRGDTLEREKLYENGNCHITLDMV